MHKTNVKLDSKGRLNLAALGIPYTPGELVEFAITGNSLVLLRRGMPDQSPADGGVGDADEGGDAPATEPDTDIRIEEP